MDSKTSYDPADGQRSPRQRSRSQFLPLPTPPWVLKGHLDASVIEDWRARGLLAGAAELIDLAEGRAVGDGRAAVAQMGHAAMSRHLMRFCRLHAAWMREFCNDRQAVIQGRIIHGLGLKLDKHGSPIVPCQALGGAQAFSFRARSEAKGIPRTMEKMDEALREELGCGSSAALLQQWQRQRKEDAAAAPQTESLGGARQDSVRELLTPACYVCDVNGAEVVLGSFADMVLLYRGLLDRTLAADGLQVVRTKNGFNADLSEEEVRSKGGYRDLKTWAMVDADGTLLAVELQLHLRCFWELKKVMHLPYECLRGSFDHPHLLGNWTGTNRSLPTSAVSGTRCCTTM